MARRNLDEQVVRITHGVVDEQVVTGCQNAANIVARMIEVGLTNIVVTRVETDVAIKQVDADNGDTRLEAVMTIAFVD